MQSSYNRIKKSLIEFCQNHPLINSFGTGNPLELHSANIISFKKQGKEHITYPLCFINLDNVNIDGSSFNYTISILLMDRIENAAKYAGAKELNDFNQDIVDDVLSDMILIGGDFITNFFNSDDYIINENPTLTPFFDNYNDVVAGVNLSMQFILPFGRSICSIPTDNLPYGVYFGVSDINTIDLNNTNPNEYVRDLSDYAVNYPSDLKYLYLAIPVDAGINYTTWHNSPLNTGEIGVGELFTEQNITIDGNNYYLYITNYKTIGRYITFK